jgi:predicted RNA-binding protein with PUA-like domain
MSESEYESEYCRSCCYESMINCACGIRICRLSHCDRIYTGPYPSYVTEETKRYFVCCIECGKKYENEVELDKLKLENNRLSKKYANEVELDELKLENNRLRKLLISHNIDPDEIPITST